MSPTNRLNKIETIFVDQQHDEDEYIEFKKHELNQPGEFHIFDIDWGSCGVVCSRTGKIKSFRKNNIKGRYTEYSGYQIKQEHTDIIDNIIDNLYKD